MAITERQLSVLEWAQERHDNSVQIAGAKTGGDRVGWLEDVAYWTAIVDALAENERLRIACASGWGEPVLVNTLRAERDAALAERDVARRDVEHLRQSLYATEESSATQYQRAEKAEAALTEARRVLGRIEWVRIGGKMQPYCPFCWEQAKDGHTPDCALAAVLAQEEPS